MKSISDRIQALAPLERRNFLRGLNVLLAAPFVSEAFRYGARELALGEAYAQAQEQQMLFLEFDFRDQVDLMHVMVPPSLAKHPARIVGADGAELTMYAHQAELREFPGNVFLTNDSLELAPHIDTVAMLDTGMPTIGAIHGHEAANGMRSPGRKMNDPSAGEPLFKPDEAHAGGSEELYGTTPTPAAFHNYYQKQLAQDTGVSFSNGFAFKGISRYKHSVYHFGAGLPGAALDRLHSRDDLFAAFPTKANTADSILSSRAQATLLTDLIYKLDQRFFVRNNCTGDPAIQRLNNVLLAEADWYTPSSGFDLHLSPKEQAYWSTDVPNQKCALGDAEVVECAATEEDADRTTNGFVKAQIWEQFGYAYKLFRSGQVRSVALEFDFMDLAGDGVRIEPVLRVQAQQVARPLARIIQLLKNAGLYDRTVIAVYTLDGSRAPGANSYGDGGKNTIVLAGGGIRGGYYGDITIEGPSERGSGHKYGFRSPDPKTGELRPVEIDWRRGGYASRTQDGDVWRTVAKAMKVPEAEYVGRFGPAVDDAQPLEFMLRG